MDTDKTKKLLSEEVPEYDDHRDEGCTEEYNEEVCPRCPNYDFNMVGHPGGSNVHSVEQYYCSLGFWREDF